MTRQGTPAELGFLRASGADHLLKRGKDRHVWRHEGVLFVLPPWCTFVRMELLSGVRGPTWIVTEPASASTLWPTWKEVVVNE